MTGPIPPRWRSSPARLIMAVSAIGIALLSSCGGEESKDGGSHRAPAAERTRFISSADPICRRAVREIEALQPSGGGPNANVLTPTTEGLVRPGIVILEREARLLDGLRPRPDDSDLQRYLGLFQPILVLAHQRLALAEGRRPDINQARRLETGIEGLEQAQAIYAKSFGFHVCGTGFFAAFGQATR